MKQIEALEILKTGANVFLTGEPGSGKSYTINMFCDWIEKNKRIYPSVTASTGIAATHINGTTIHSWSGIGIHEVITPSIIKNILGKSYVVNRIQNAKILIIDEISMINGQTLDNVDKICREVRAERDMTARGKSFGGIQIIFVGDFFQLPPVTKDGKKTKFAFESNAWLSAEPKICYLTEQHRQEDQEFLEILTGLRAGKITKKNLARLEKCKRKAPKDITRLFTHNADVDRVNAEELAKIKDTTKTFTMMSSVAYPSFQFMIDILKKSCLSPERLHLKIGAPVMFTRNDTQKDGSIGEYVNGTLGKVTEFDPYPVVKTNDGRTIRLSKLAEWSIIEKGETKASIRQIPLRLAWAITVHKCQGMSLDSATMDLSQAFEYGQGYVALSRVRSLKGLYLEGLNDKALLMHPTVVKKDGLFRKLSETLDTTELSNNEVDTAPIFEDDFIDPDDIPF